MQLPRMLRIRQKFDAPQVNNVAHEVREQLRSLQLEQELAPGQSVAITAGSRGIAEVVMILKTIVEHFKSLGAKPFLVPAMGSHGGATAEGQLEVLRQYGITPESVGAEIRSSMDTVVLGHSPEGIPIHFDRCAFEADHVFLFNRVKSHTSLSGQIESGLHKMLLIGLGKHAGAEIYHRAFVDVGFERLVRSVVPLVVQRCRILGGLAVVENARKQIAVVEAVRPEDFWECERRLLALAKKWMPNLPFRFVDLLIVDEIGKDISGTGMDTNVVGRKFHYHSSTEQDAVQCKRIFVRGLSSKTGGNGNGIGMADVTNRRTLEAIDRQVTALNALTANRPPSAALPIAFETDRRCVEAMLKCIGMVEPENARVVQISNTLELEELLASEAYAEEIEQREDLELLEPAAPMPFDSQDNLLPVRRKN